MSEPTCRYCGGWSEDMIMHEAYCVMRPDEDAAPSPPQDPRDEALRVAREARKALEQITVLAEYNTTGPGKCRSEKLTAEQATSLRKAISDIAREALRQIKELMGEK